MSAELDHIWSHVQLKLADTVEEPVYRIWLEPLRARSLDDNHLTVEAPAHACGWVRERFGRLLSACTAAVLGPHVTADVVPASEAAKGRDAPAPAAGRRRSTDAGERQAAPAQLQAPAENPKLTFDQFVIGDSNRLAHAAALTVSELPAQAYNPLFICGPPGVGKTHLLRAIASLMAAHNPRLVVRSTTGEAFTSEFIAALGSSRLDSFKAGFRHVDVLLIDDVQFLERKTRTEEEFFHTFNSLYECGSQIVLSSDRPPADLQALEDRLRERFGAGLVADIRPPDYQTRLAILRKRAHQDGIDAPDERALELIAERVTTNVRALEGALIRAVAFSSLTSRPLTSELVEEVVDGLYPRSAPRPTSITEIKAAVCERFGVSSEELVSSTRTARVTWPRQAAMYLARELTSQSLPSIGREFGGRDHTTVMHALKRAETQIAGDPTLRRAVDELRKHLAGNS
ncbi:MAG: chromosomal replication initiator protein DnaA [Solirubrobacteraceae bacterium]